MVPHAPLTENLISEFEAADVRLVMDWMTTEIYRASAAAGCEKGLHSVVRERW